YAEIINAPTLEPTPEHLMQVERDIFPMRDHTGKEIDAGTLDDWIAHPTDPEKKFKGYRGGASSGGTATVARGMLQPELFFAGSQRTNLIPLYSGAEWLWVKRREKVEPYI